MELQQARRLLQRFLTDGLPPAANHCGFLTEGDGISLQLVSSMRHQRPDLYLYREAWESG